MKRAPHKNTAFNYYFHFTAGTVPKFVTTALLDNLHLNGSVDTRLER